MLKCKIKDNHTGAYVPHQAWTNFHVPVHVSKICVIIQIAERGGKHIVA